MAGIFRKVLGNRQKIKLASEKPEPSAELTVKNGQTASVNVDLINRFKTLKQDIHAAASDKDKEKVEL